MCQNWARPQHTGECSERRAREHYEPALPRLVLCKSPPRAGRKPKRQKLSASVCLHAKCVIYARAQRRSDFSFLSLFVARYGTDGRRRGPGFALDFILYIYNARGEHKRAAAGERGDKESFYEVNQESNKKIPARQLIYM
jgi:hypothetical protein